MKYISKSKHPYFSNIQLLCTVLLFLLSTGFHNHAIQIAPFTNSNIEEPEHNSGLLHSVEFCTAHTAHSGMDRSFVCDFQIIGFGNFENLIFCDEPSDDLNILSKNSPRSPPFV